jgi:hypothetical protein
MYREPKLGFFQNVKGSKENGLEVARFKKK